MKLLDIISKKYNISKRLAKKYIYESKITFNNRVVKNNIDIDESEINLISLHVDKKKWHEAIALNNYLIKDFGEIVFFYKPASMHTVRHRIEDEASLEDIVKTYNPTFTLISRLDYETDGVIAAISPTFNITFQEKKYLALVHGILSKNCIIENEIDYKKRKKVKVLENKGNKKTVVEVIKTIGDKSLIRAKIDKANRHQIRAHLSYISHPIVGDKMYGIDDSSKRLMLTCYYNKINEYSCYSNNLNIFYKFMKELI